MGDLVKRILKECCGHNYNRTEISGKVTYIMNRGADCDKYYQLSIERTDKGHEGEDDYVNLQNPHGLHGWLEGESFLGSYKDIEGIVRQKEVGCEYNFCVYGTNFDERNQTIRYFKKVEH